jgi:hypothetical protein
LGKPGDPAKGGVPFEEYLRRQELHRHAEIESMIDTAHFIDRAQDIYGYDHFVCDTSGSICEVVDPWDENDPVLTQLSSLSLMVWIEGSDAHTEELVRRFDRAPKPMYYKRKFLEDRWAEYLEMTGDTPDDVDPNAFVRWTYAKALAHRQPRYDAMSKWGVKVSADEMARVKSSSDFNALIATALERR